MQLQYLTNKCFDRQRSDNGNHFSDSVERLFMELLNGSLLGKDLFGHDRDRERNCQDLGSSQHGFNENRSLHGRRQDLLHHPERRLIIRQRVHIDDNQIGNRVGNGHNEPDGNRIRIGDPCDPDGNTQFQFQVCRMVGRLLGNTDHLHRDYVEERKRNGYFYGTLLAVELM